MLFLDNIMEKNTEELSKKDLISKMIDLEYKIVRWGMINSQSNPGAVMELREMHKDLEKIKKKLGFN